jgi:hypothetical protein
MIIMLFLSYRLCRICKAIAERIKKLKQFETGPKIKTLSTLNGLYKGIDSVSEEFYIIKMSEILRTCVPKQCNFNAIWK